MHLAEACLNPLPPRWRFSVTRSAAHRHPVGGGAPAAPWMKTALWPSTKKPGRSDRCIRQFASFHPSSASRGARSCAPGSHARRLTQSGLGNSGRMPTNPLETLRALGEQLRQTVGEELGEQLEGFRRQEPERSLGELQAELDG